MPNKEAPTVDSRPPPNPASRWLSQDFSLLSARCRSQPPPLWDLVIVGSGYGGAMAACELAGGLNERGEPLRICVLERGREYLPGMFPSRWSELGGHMRFSTGTQPRPRGTNEGLFDFRLGPDASALLANGLGGGSLINAAVMEIPRFEQFASGLPDAVVRDLHALYEETKVLLGGAVRGADGISDNTIARHDTVAGRPLKKRVALELLARQAGGASRDAALTTEMKGGLNDQGIRLDRCSLCGDCMTGCNVGAKKSLDTNLLVQARRAGAEIYTGVSVMQIERLAAPQPDEGGRVWQLELVHTDPGLRQKRGEPDLLLARKVILAAGTFGSTEILLRSQGRNKLRRKLSLSPRLGEGFSCNGDNLAAIHKMRGEARPHAEETQPLQPSSEPGRHVGPTITGIVDMRPDPGQPGFLLQEFAVPAPLARLFGELVTTGDALNALPDADWSTHRPGRGERDPLAVDPQAMHHTMLVGFIGHDQAAGKLSLPSGYVDSALSTAKAAAYEGGLRLEWDCAWQDGAVNRAFAAFEKAAKALGRIVPNPLWRLLPPDLASLAGQAGGGLLTVHPLGGCAIGSDWRHGVVDGHGMVFDCAPSVDAADSERPGDPWQGSLLVLDGSILPGSLGANPALTIAALSLRAARHWRTQWGWRRSPAPDRVQVPDRPAYREPLACTDKRIDATRLQIVERLSGPVRLGQGEEYQLELTLAFEPMPIHLLSASMGRRLGLDHSRDGQEPVNRIRLFSADTWRSSRLDMKGEFERTRHVLAEARVDGTLYLLDREGAGWPRRMLRGGLAYLANRGLRDLWQSRSVAASGARAEPEGLGTTLWKGLKLATRAGEVRRFDYVLDVTEILSQREGLSLLRAGDRVQGHKRLTYGRRSNPWNQLLYLELTCFPGLSLGWGGRPPLLKLDAGFLAKKGVALARVASQQDQPTALAELASFGLYWVRLMLYVHLWSFRAPDPAPLRLPQRLPGVMPGLPPPEIEEIDLVARGEPVRVRLTRYPHRQADSHARPLVMIHGYSASGTTFAHPALDVSMAQYFWNLQRDVWIVDLRTSAGMPTAKLYWSFEEVACNDIPRAIERIVAQVAGERQVDESTVQVDVFAHCVGAVMLSMALLAQDGERARRSGAGDASLERLPSRVHRIVLSQKGMALAYSDANVLRAYVLRFLRPLLLADGYSFRPPPHNPSAADRLLDRFLSALPYPAHEFDRENPLRPWARTAWSATRHRMDALYERTFNIANMSEAVLDSIDDFFGPLNVETVSQTIHFARHQAITDASGRNVFVNSQALLRWPSNGTLSVHGGDNGMVDSYTLNLMAGTMALAGVPFETHLLAQDVGHQDSLIGRQAVDTFRRVQAFLSAPQAPAAQTAGSGPELGLPWLGPRLHVTPTDGVEVRPDGEVCNQSPGEVRLLIAADPGRGEAQAVIVPVKTTPSGYVACGKEHYDTWTVRPYDGWLSMRLPYSEDDSDGFLVLTRACYPGSSHWGEKSLPPPSPRMPRSQVQAQLDVRGHLLTEAFISSEAIRKSRPATAAGRGPVSLVLASCQYPAGILDAGPAGASLARLNARAELDEAAPTCAVLMMGDQIYADATAGLLDPSRTDDRYGRSHADWLQAPPLREIMRRVPVHMMLDDHELADNWEHGHRLGDTDADAAAGKSSKGQAIDSYWRYQRAARPIATATHLWFRVEVGGLDIFVADTRTERKPRPAQADGLGHIMSSAQDEALGLWLADQKRLDAGGPPRPKFLATASWLAPRRAGTPGEADTPLRADGWEGYPESMAELLGRIASQDIRGVVVLTGDAHLGCYTELLIRPVGSAGGVKVISIAAPAMYAPFAFANARAQDYRLQDRIEFTFQEVDYECVVDAQCTPPGDGFVVLETSQVAGAGWQVAAKICQGDLTQERIWLLE